MKVFIDTNILISTALFPKSVPAKAFYKAVTAPYDAVICDQNVEEIKRIFNKKFPDKISVLNTFLALIMTSVSIVMVPDAPIPDEARIRDEKDRPIFRAAVCSGAEIFLTGDKDFLESRITDPRVLSPSAFLDRKSDAT